MNFEAFEEEILTTVYTQVERIAMLNRLADLYNRMLTEMTINTEVPKPKRTKKMVVETTCPGPYWRTAEFVKQHPNTLLSTDCKALEKPRYKGPVITSAEEEEFVQPRICGTCYARWKHDQKLKK